MVQLSMSVPKNLQGILWSRDVNNLDLDEDSAYIINQVLAYGTFESLKWLFKTYSKDKITKIFIKKPIKTYTHASFNFAKNILLEDKTNLKEGRYIENTPRHI